jgi:hypothetical protein
MTNYTSKLKTVRKPKINQMGQRDMPYKEEKYPIRIPEEVRG